MYGFSPQHLSHATGKSLTYQPCLLIPVFVAKPLYLFIEGSYNYKKIQMSKYNIGHMKFPRQLSNSQRKIAQNLDLQSLFQIDEWWLAEGQFSFEHMDEIFSISHQITAKDIDFYENERSSIIKDICHIDFPFLTCLKLSSNNIQSLIAIQYIKAPNLEHLCLSSNNTTCLKTLRKAFFPNLKGIMLHQNKIVDYSPLVECNWSLNLDYLQLEIDDQVSFIKPDNIAWIFKIKQATIKRLSWFNEGTIINSKMLLMLRQKFGKQTLIDRKK